jgi:phosphatidylglycerophosphate synthase
MVRVNIPNFITLVRVSLVFLGVIFLSLPSYQIKLFSFAVIGISFLLDYVDGLAARRLGCVTRIGSLIDTLGDRITENVLLIFFSFCQVIPIYVPIFFITRSLLADFIRTIAYKSGLGVFEISRSRLGKALVSSRWSRVTYSSLKMTVIFLSMVILVKVKFATEYLAFLKNSNLLLVTLLVIFSFIRFIALLCDAGGVLKRGFL